MTIWVIRVGDSLYVRSYRGREGSWFQRAHATQHGQIRAGGAEKAVSFVERHDIEYGRYGARYMDPMLATDARATTLEFVPR